MTGLVRDTELVGIDYRIQDGGLYGVGDAGGVYELTPRGAATKVSQLTTALDGTLTYPPLTSPATGVTGAACTNNDLDPSSATSRFVPRGCGGHRHRDPHRAVVPGGRFAGATVRG